MALCSVIRDAALGDGVTFRRLPTFDDARQNNTSENPYLHSTEHVDCYQTLVGRCCSMLPSVLIIYIIGISNIWLRFCDHALLVRSTLQKSPLLFLTFFVRHPAAVLPLLNQLSCTPFGCCPPGCWWPRHAYICVCSRNSTIGFGSNSETFAFNFIMIDCQCAVSSPSVILFVSCTDL